jgi:signal transduction histidine kinase
LTIPGTPPAPRAVQPKPDDEGTPGAAMWLLSYLTRRPRWNPAISLLIIASLVLLIGLLGYLTGPHLSLRLFYDIPVALAVAWLGWRTGVATSVASVGVWIASEGMAGAEFVRRTGLWWNALIAICMYVVVALILSAFISLHRRLEERVRQRTAALQSEVMARARLQHEILDISERERSSIGRDLHDGLCQHLVGTALAAQVLSEQLGSRGDPAAGSARGIVSLVEEAIAQTRSLANGLLLAAIQPDRLAAELEKLARIVSEKHGIDCRLLLRGEPRAPDEATASHLFRIAQEAVRNSLKHARPSRLEIVFSDEGGHLTLTVSDDGTGLPRKRRGPGLGLRIMAHRAELIRADFAVEPGAGGGTRVRCRLPDRASAN